MDKTDLGLVLIAVLVLGYTGYAIAQPFQSPGVGGGGGTNPGEPGLLSKPYAYMIYKEGNNVFASSGSTESTPQRLFSGTAETVFDNVLSATTTGTIFVKSAATAYSLTTSKTWKSNVNLVCEGFNAQITIDAGAIDLISIPDGASNILIQNCYMRNYSIAVGSGIIATVGSVTALNVIHNFLVGSNGAVETQSCSDCVIDGNAIQATRTAISLRSLFRTIISDNMVLNTNDNCIDIGTVQDVTVTGNICRDTVGTPTTINGIYVDTVQGALSITGNEIRNILRNGIQLNTVTGVMSWVTISGNTIIQPGQVSGGDAGIYLFGTATTRIYNVTITGNTISHPGRQGILIEYSTNIVVTGNILNNGGTLSGANGYGLRADQTDELVVTGNRATGNSQYGIGVFSSSTNILVTNNDVRGNTVGGISISATTYMVAYNLGYATENWGGTSVADGGTISHGLAGTPDSVTITCSVASQMCSVTAVAATTFTVAIKTDTGAAGTTQTVYWYAVFIP